MKRMRLAISMAFVLAVAGCGGSTVAMKTETAVQQDQVPGQTDVDPAGLPESTKAQDDQDDTAMEEDLLAEDRQQVEQAIKEAEARDEAASRPDADEFAAEEAERRATADFAPYVSTGGHTEFDGRDVRAAIPWC